MDIEVEAATAEWLDAHAKGQRIHTGARYAGKLLQAIVDVLNKQNQRLDGLTADEEKLVEERLRALGYIE